MPLGTPLPVFASWGKRVVAAVLDGAIGAGATFLAFGDQAVNVPFIGAALEPTGVQGVPTTSWTDSGWVSDSVGRPGTAALVGSASGTPVVVRSHSRQRGDLCRWRALLLRVIGSWAPRHLLRDDGIE